MTEGPTKDVFTDTSEHAAAEIDPAESETVRSNVHCLNEWRLRRDERHRDLLDDGWMRRQRALRQRAPRRTVYPASGTRAPIGRHTMRTGPTLYDINHPGSMARRRLLGRRRKARIFSAFAWAGGVLALITGLLWWRTLPPKPLPDPMPPHLRVQTHIAANPGETGSPIVFDQRSELRPSNPEGKLLEPRS